MMVLNSFVLIGAMVVSFLFFIAGCIAWQVRIESTRPTAIAGIFWWISVFFVRWSVLTDRSTGDKLLNDQQSDWLIKALMSPELKAGLFLILLCLLGWSIYAGAEITRRIEKYHESKSV